MQQDDIQKRMLIFFVAVSVLIVSFSVVSSVFFNKNQPEQNTAAQAEKPQQATTSLNTLNLKLPALSNQTPGETVKVETDRGYVQISPAGGQIVSIYDRHYNIDMVTDFARKQGLFAGQIITDDPALTQLLNSSVYEITEKGENRVSFTLKGEGFEVVKRFTVNPDATVEFSFYMRGLENHRLWLLSAVTLNTEGSFGHEGPVVKTNKDLVKYDADEIKSEVSLRDEVLWAGEENKYFKQIVAVKGGSQEVRILPVGKDTTAVLVGISPAAEGFVFGGPKLYSLLGEINQKYQRLWGTDLDLRSSIDFGFFGIFGKPLFLLLHFFYQYIPNWGVAIIILTVLIRILFFPLNHKSLKAMKKMADLAPEIEKLKKKYGKDPQKLQEEMMKLYAQAGANPLSGCLPILVQIPVFIALYNVLMVTVELKGAPFILWIKDLSDKDPYYVLPVLMGLSMVAQQFITPSSDKNQQIIMYVLAGVFTFMFLTFPAGLVLYWLTNNILGLIQSLIVNKMMKG